VRIACVVVAAALAYWIGASSQFRACSLMVSWSFRGGIALLVVGTIFQPLYALADKTREELLSKRSQFI
jgi:hypothetical protein